MATLREQKNLWAVWQVTVDYERDHRTVLLSIEMTELEEMARRPRFDDFMHHMRHVSD